MKNLQRYIGINLGLLVFYTVLIKVMTMGEKAGLGYVILMLLLVSGHTFINFIASIVQFTRGDRENGKTLLLCTGVVLVVGFSACIGGASLVF